jgi:hypothetical protein
VVEPTNTQGAFKQTFNRYVSGATNDYEMPMMERVLMVMPTLISIVCKTKLCYPGKSLAV